MKEVETPAEDVYHKGELVLIHLVDNLYPLYFKKKLSQSEDRASISELI
jgi:hypothetical protein